MEATREQADMVGFLTYQVYRGWRQKLGDRHARIAALVHMDQTVKRFWPGAIDRTELDFNGDPDRAVYHVDFHSDTSRFYAAIYPDGPRVIEVEPTK